MPAFTYASGRNLASDFHVQAKFIRPQLVLAEEEYSNQGGLSLLGCCLDCLKYPVDLLAVAP